MHGMNKHLTKPFTQDMLLAALADAIADGKKCDEVNDSPDMQLFDTAIIEHITAFFSKETVFCYLQTIERNSQSLLCALEEFETDFAAMELAHELVGSAGMLRLTTVFQPQLDDLSMPLRRTRQTRPSIRIAYASPLRTRYPKFNGSRRPTWRIRPASLALMGGLWGFFRNWQQLQVQSIIGQNIHPLRQVRASRHPWQHRLRKRGDREYVAPPRRQVQIETCRDQTLPSRS